MCAHFTRWQTRAEDRVAHPPTAPRVCPTRHCPQASPAKCIYSLGKGDVPIQAFQHGEPGVPVHLRWQTHPSQELHIAHRHGSPPSSFYMQDGKISSFPGEEDVLPGLLCPALNAACPMLDVLNLTSLRKPTRCWAPHWRGRPSRGSPCLFSRNFV